MKAASFPGSIRCPFCNALATRQEAIDRHVMRRHMNSGLVYKTRKGGKANEAQQQGTIY